MSIYKTHEKYRKLLIGILEDSLNIQIYEETCSSLGVGVTLEELNKIEDRINKDLFPRAKYFFEWNKLAFTFNELLDAVYKHMEKEVDDTLNEIINEDPKLKEACFKEMFHDDDVAKVALKGVSPDTPIETNFQGGKQSKSEYAFHLIPPEALLELANVFAEGAKKYERDNWLKIPAEEHFNHALVHYYAAVLGDTQDNHLGHFLCRAVMAYFMMQKAKGEKKNG